MNKQKLRIGLLIDNYSIPLWVYTMIAKINLSNHSQIVLVVKKKSKTIKKGSFFSRLWNKRSLLIYVLYTRFEKQIYKPNPNAFKVKNLKEIIDCPEILVQPKVTKSSDRISKEDLDQIAKHNIDVFIRIGFEMLIGDILKSAKYGVWSYLHCDNRVKRGGPSGVWEMLEKRDESSVTLQILNEDLDGNHKLYQSFYLTANLFINRNINDLYWKAKSMLPRKLEELFRLGEIAFFQKLKKWDTEPLFYYNRLYKKPNNYETIKGLFRLYWNAFKEVLRRKFFFSQWIVLYKLESSKKISKSFFKFKRLIPPKDRFWADPFIIEKNNMFYIYIEEFVYNENKGKISVLEMDENGNYGEPIVVLETDYHLSYPFLIEDNGELYMLPETEDNETVELYKCVEFPYKWELVEILIDNIKSVDSTIYKYNNRYWLFTNVTEYKGESTASELFLFYSDSLINGEWKSHFQNPLAVDRNYSRPAGNIFVYKDRIFRPAQNCSKHYGYGMQIREIITLNENDYEERHIQSIYPNWDKDLLSTHTLNSSGRLTVIDALIRRRR